MRLMNIIVSVELSANCFIILTSPLTDALTIKECAEFFWPKLNTFLLLSAYYEFSSGNKQGDTVLEISNFKNLQRNHIMKQKYTQ